MRTKIFTGILVAAFLSVAAGASVAYYQSGNDSSQTFNPQHLKALLAPPSWPPFGVAAEIGSVNAAKLRYYLVDAQLMFYAALALTGVFCCAMAAARAVKWAQAVPEIARQRNSRLHAMDIFRPSSGAQRVPSESHSGLKARLTRWFGAIAVLLSAASFLLVYSKLFNQLHQHGIQSGRAIAINVADAVTPQLANGDTAELRRILLGHLSRNPLAYILVLDGNHKPVAYVGPEVSEPARTLRAGLIVDAQGERSTRLHNRVAYGLVAPVDNGRMGFVQVGLWRARIEDQARKVLFVVAVLFVAMTYGAILGARRLFARITQPLEELVASAEGLSRGDLETAIVISASGPMAQLGDALERVRNTLKPAISRLKAELDVPARVMVLGALARDLGEQDNLRIGDPE